MRFPSDWPPNCPPADAEDANGEVFRIVKNQPPTDADMLSHRESGRMPQAPACLRCGLSVFRAIDDAINQQNLMPKLGRFIAKGGLRPEHGKTKLTPGQQQTHTTWWPFNGVSRAQLFAVVQEVV